ncbi:hypothetical protein GW17_00012428, partial [Ensete ventricosum]
GGTRSVVDIGSGSMEEGAAEEGDVCAKVMTDEQMEVLRKQIAAYATICEQLVEMHRAIAAQQDWLSGMRLGSLCSDPLMAPGVAELSSSRQRWTPTPTQLQILETIFYEGNGTPSKQKIKEITSELTQHGQISETNVYNWFQNRRARSKRKKQPAAGPNAAESEAEVESLNEKKAKAETFAHGDLSPTLDEGRFQSPDISSELRFGDPESNGSQGMFALGDISKYGDAF